MIEEWQYQQRRALPLATKIEFSKNRIKAFVHEVRGRGLEPVVSFSGGLDSTVVLHLVRSLFPEIRGVFANTGLEYPGIVENVKRYENIVMVRPEKTFKQVLEEEGYPVISKNVATTIKYYHKGSDWARYRFSDECNWHNRYHKYEYLLKAPFKISDRCCSIIKERPTEKWQRKNKAVPIMGLRAEESQRRKDAYLATGCNSFTGKIKSSPISFWTRQDVLCYILDNKLPIPFEYGEIIEEKGKLRCTKHQRTGCIFCCFGVQREKSPNRFECLKEEYPQLYKYAMEKLGLDEVLNFIGVKH